MISKKIRLDKSALFTLLPFVFVLSIYLHNLSSSVYGGDAGDFASAIIDGGIAHPPGYPLYLLLGGLFYSFPFAATPAWKIGLLSVVTSSLTVGVMFLLLRHQVKSYFLALIAALTLAFVYPFWLYAEVVEVFSLHLFLVSLLLFFSVLSMREPTRTYIYAISLLFGLSLAHHQTVLLLAPAVLFALFSKRTLALFRPQTIGFCILLFLIGLSFYLYLPIASANDSLLTWAKIDSAQSLYSFATRQEYGWGFGVIVALSDRFLALQSYVTYWFYHLPLPFFVVSFFGAYRLLQHDRRLLSFILLGFIFTGPVFFFYSGNRLGNSFALGVQERFYITSFLFFLLLFPQGILQCTQWIQDFLKKSVSHFSPSIRFRFLLQSLFLALPLYLFLSNFPRTNLRNVWIGDYYARDVLTSLPKGSILFTSSDTLSFNITYMQQAYSLREDVTQARKRRIKEYIDSTPLYYEQYKSIASSSPSLSQNDRILATIFSTPDRRLVFSDIALGIRLGEAMPDWEPYGLPVRAREKDERVRSKEEFLRLQEKLFAGYHGEEVKHSAQSESTTLTLLEIPTKYADSYARIGEYLLFYYKDPQAAKVYFEKSLSLLPNHQVALFRLEGFSKGNKN